MTDRVYVGKRSFGRATGVFVERQHTERPLDPHTDIVDASLGFEWGYGGSGPKQTALAILIDATGDADLATRLHLDFVIDVIQHLDPKGGFRIPGALVQAWVWEREHKPNR